MAAGIIFLNTLTIIKFIPKDEDIQNEIEILSCKSSHAGENSENVDIK